MSKELTETVGACTEPSFIISFTNVVAGTGCSVGWVSMTPGLSREPRVLVGSAGAMQLDSLAEGAGLKEVVAAAAAAASLTMLCTAKESLC